MVDVIERLSDLKEIFSKIPDEDLEKFGVGVNIESDDEICLLVEDEADIGLFEKYPDLTKVDKYIRNICLSTLNIENCDVNSEDYVDEPFITSKNAIV